MIISLRDRSWKEEGQSLEHAILLKRASGKPLKKKALIEVLNGVWKVSELSSFQRVESNVLLANFTSVIDRDRVLERRALVL